MGGGIHGSGKGVFEQNINKARTSLSQKGNKYDKEYAETALKLATCDGPPYYYKVEYEEAERFLENLK